jgi:Spy/CpxP family protein refolding chaperone
MLLAALPLRAQQEPEGPPFRRGAPQRDEVFKIVDAYMVSNLQESLGLTDDQFVKLLPLVKRLQSDRRGFAVRRMELVVEMRRLLNAGGAGEARIGELMKDMRALEAEEPPVMRKDVEAVDAALSPVQQAKLRIMEIEVDRRIRELMIRGRGPTARPDEAPRRRDARPQQPPGGPGL